MNGLDYIKTKQTVWAKRNNKDLHSRGKEMPNSGEKDYIDRLGDNLFRELSSETIKQFEKADGGEINDGKKQRAKMQAIHSSSALVVNVFEYCKDDITPLAFACGLCSKDNNYKKELRFEEKFRISDDKIQFPRDPNIDIVIDCVDTHKIYAIESKFSEPYSGKHNGISSKYIKNDCFWDGLENLKELAISISSENNKFKYLDAAQLIKHILGLTKGKRCRNKSNFRLLYLWYDVIGKEGMKHREEIEEFAKIAKDDKIDFLHRTYQEVIINLLNMKDFFDRNKNYCTYIADRYL
jgi:hypothetical protein